MKKASLFILLLLIPGLMSAQWVIDNSYGFKINVPSEWSRESKLEGTDKIYDFVHPSNNIFLEVRAFKIDGTITPDAIAQFFESQYLPGSNRVAFENYTLNNTLGKFGGYTMELDGLEVGIGTFYAVKNGFGYVLWTMIETRLYNQYSGIGDEVLNTFTTISATSTSKRAVIPPSFKITNMKLGKSLTSNYDILPQEETKEFQSSQEKIFVIWDWEGMAAGKNMTVKWYYNGQEISIANKSYTIPDEPQGYGYANILRPSGGFKVGRYYVQIDFQGKKQRRMDFEVEKPASTAGAGFVITPPKRDGNASVSQGSGSSNLGAKKIVLISTGSQSCYSFKTGKIHGDHKNADIMVEPWCTEDVGVCGNWLVTNYTNMDAVTSAPSTGYLSDGKSFTDCDVMAMNKVVIVKLKDGTYAKMMILKTDFTKSNSQNPPCQHKVTILVEYPSF